MILFEHYIRRLRSIQVQFDFAREAIRGFIHQSDPSLRVPEEPPSAVPLADLAKPDDKFMESLYKSIEAVKGRFPDKHKDLENMLAQNEIVLTVAVFEDQMKAIHREILRQNPSLLNPDREIKLGKLIALQQDRVIEDEVEVTVQALDRKSVKDRAKAFEKLGLPWKHRIEAIEQATTLRNRILHENTTCASTPLIRGMSRMR